jgi:ribonucleoside-diphosphate reductase alpha chain
MSQSIMDYIFRRLALDYLPFEQREGMGIFSADERQRYLETGSYEPIAEETGGAAELIQDAPVVEIVEEDSSPVVEQRAPASVVETPAATEGTYTQEAHTSAELMEKITGTAVDSPLCFTCGTKMRPAGSCYVCEGCGSTSGCS